MIDRQGSKVLIECDSCDDVFAGKDHEEFKEVWSRARDEGWRTRKTGKDWTHGCPRHEP